LKILKRPVNIVCVKTGTKYSINHVKTLYKMVKKNLTLPFIFYCLTDNVDNLPEEVVGIKLDASLDLESYWWKICLFDLGWNESVLYFDLDVIIQRNFDYIFKNIDNKKLKCLNTGQIGIFYPYDGSPDNILTIPPALINTSIMLFNPLENKYIFNKFMNDVNYNIVKYYGLDRFINHNSENLMYFDFSTDYYFRAKGDEFYDPKFVDENKLIKDPNKTFCIMNQCKPEHYIGMEEYLL